MRLLLLSSEDFETDYKLTSIGKSNIKYLLEKLEDININYIYSSPLRSTLQTISDFSNKRNININIDYSLAEYNYPINSYELSLDELGFYNFNEDYYSFLAKNSCYYPEDINLLKNRIYNFITYLSTKHENDSVLLVSHNTVINSIIHNYITHYDINTLYNYGKLTEIQLKNDEYKLLEY